MKYLQLLAFLSLFSFACTEREKKESTNVPTIGAGQMPAITKDANNNLHIVYGYGDSIMYTSSSDGGTSFGNPVLIDTLKDLVDYATRGPQITSTKNGLAIIAVNKQGNIFSFIKDQSGKWSRTAKVNDADTTNKEGFLGLSGDGDNTVFAIWPDLRNNGQQKVYGARSTDGGQTWSKNILIYDSPDGTICECCKQSVVMNGKNVYVMFRNLINGNRDLYLINSSDGGATFGEAQKLGYGNWQLAGCPMDGGELSVVAGEVQTTWRRKDSIFYAEPGKQEEFIAKGKHCTISSEGNITAIAWEADKKIYYKLNSKTEQLLGDGNSAVLQLTSQNKLLCVWTDSGSVKYRLINI